MTAAGTPLAAPRHVTTDSRTAPATPVNGTFVYVFDATTSAYMGAATMGAAGAYSFDACHAGSYKVYTQTNTPRLPPTSGSAGTTSRPPPPSR